MTFTFFPIIFLVDKKLQSLRDKIVMDVDEISILELCIEKFKRYDVVIFELDDRTCEMVLEITELKRSSMFVKLWSKYCKELKEEVITMEVIFDKIWSKVCEKLKLISTQILNGEMQLKKLDKYLNMFGLDYTTLKSELILLLRYFNGTAINLKKVTKNLNIVINKVKNYKKLSNTRQAAQTVLQLQEAMGLHGDFSEVKKIAEEVRLYTLFYSNEYYSQL